MSEARSAAGRKGAAKTNAKRAPGARPKAQPRECLCGCGNTTKGGSFLQGHDAKYKSELVRRGLQEEPKALAELEARGWTKFLTKAQEVKARPTREPSDRQPAERTESIEATIDNYMGKRQAGGRLKEVKRYTRQAENGHLEITDRNWRRIMEMTDKQLLATTQEDLDV